MTEAFDSKPFPLLVIFLQLVGINLHLFQYVGNGFSLITIQSWRNIDVVAGVMKVLRGISCVLEAFSFTRDISENVHKKIGTYVLSGGPLKKRLKNCSVHCPVHLHILEAYRLQCAAFL